MAKKEIAYRREVSDIIWDQLCVATEIHDWALIKSFNLLREYAESFEEYGLKREYSCACDHTDIAIVNLATSIANMTYDKMKRDGASIDGFNLKDRQVAYDKTGKAINRTYSPLRPQEEDNG